MSKEAMKLALECIERGGGIREGNTVYLHDHDLMRIARDALREALAEQPAQQEPVADRENAIIRFALHQFMSNAYSHMNAAAQDKDNRHYTAGAVEKFAKDAKDAEALLSRLQFKAPQPAQQEPLKLWLWKNFVKGRPEYWAFDNPFPCLTVNGDPLTFGEPCGWAFLKPSVNGRPERSEQEVINTITRLADTSPPARQRHISYACPQCHWSLEEQPAQRTWVGLTPEQRATIAEANNMLVDDDLFDAIEAKLKEKNT